MISESIFDGEQTLREFLIKVTTEAPALIDPPMSVIADAVEIHRPDGLTRTMTLSEFYGAWYLPNVCVAA